MSSPSLSVGAPRSSGGDHGSSGGRPRAIRGRPRVIWGRPRTIWGRPPMVWGRPRIIQNRFLMHRPRPQPPKRHAFEASYGPFQNRGRPAIDPRGAPRIGSRPHRQRQRLRLRSGSDRGTAVECASPLALWAAKMRWTGFPGPHTVAAINRDKLQFRGSNIMIWL